jgi:hypothetical protein
MSTTCWAELQNAARRRVADHRTGMYSPIAGRSYVCNHQRAAFSLDGGKGNMTKMCQQMIDKVSYIHTRNLRLPNYYERKLRATGG